MAAPHPPSDSRGAIGEGDGSDIVTSGPSLSHGPGLELIRLVHTVNCEEIKKAMKVSVVWQEGQISGNTS